MKNNDEVKKGKITLKTKKLFEKLIQEYCELEETYYEIYDLAQNFADELNSINLIFDRSDQIISIFQHLSAEFPWQVTSDFIDYMKDMTDNQYISDDNFYEILVNQKNIDEFFDIIESDY